LTASIGERLRLSENKAKPAKTLSSVGKLDEESKRHNATTPLCHIKVFLSHNHNKDLFVVRHAGLL